MKKTKIRLAIIEDDPVVAEFISSVAKELGLEVVLVCSSPKSAFNEIMDRKAQMVLLDINLGKGKEGIEIGRQIQSLGVMILYASAYTQSSIVSEALANNPENYLIKPFSEQELSIALSLVRDKYYTQHIAPRYKKLCWGDGYCFDLESCSLSYRGKRVALTPIELRVIEYMCRKINKVVTHNELVYAVWDGKDVADTTLRECIYRLRKKVPNLPLVSIPKVGYEFQSQVPNGDAL